MTKTAFVFKASAENFIEEAQRAGRRVYFWTFTFKECTTVKEGSKKWTLLLQTLKRNFIRIAGVRRYELHPRGHGLQSPTRFNGTLDTLHHVFEEAVKCHARQENPVSRISRCSVRAKHSPIQQRSATGRRETGVLKKTSEGVL